MISRTINHFFLLIIVLTLGVACEQTSRQNTSNAKNVNQNDNSGSNFIDSFLNKARSQPDFVADLEEIRKRDTLKAITTYSSTSYFLYQGEPLGYEYELAQRLADYLDVELQMIVAKDLDDILNLLNEGEGDLIAHSLTVTGDRKEVVDFTYPLNFTHQVLVQRKPDNWRQMKLHEIEKTLVRNPIRLIGLDIHVRENSSYNDRLINLQNELGGEINVRYLPGSMTTDAIIKMVSEGEIDYTVADHNIAQINAAYYNNLDIQTTVGVMQQLAWAVRKTSPDLLKAINNWIKEERKSSDYYVIYNKYFKNTRGFTKRVKSDFYSRESNKISQYDDLIKQGAAELGWDWRFLTSLIYQESKFDSNEKSWVGAVGLMQLMPRTAKSYGYTKLTNPNSNIKAGVAHINYLNEFWAEHIEDSTERVKFVIASYNAGQYHVQDARRLAAKYGLNPNIWYNEVEAAMLLKSEKKYFNDPVVHYGYCRGEEPVNYVKEIFERYEYYKEFISLEEEKLVSRL